MHKKITKLSNILWLIFGGFLLSMLWYLAGILMFITIIGIPKGLKFFKFGKLMLSPFGKEVVINYKDNKLFNLIWAILLGWELFLVHIALAVTLALSIIGLPFAYQIFKMSKLALFPVGAVIKQVV